MKIDHINKFSYNAKGHFLKWIRIDFLIIFTVAWLESLTIRFLLSRSKFCLPYSCKIDWKLGLYCPSPNEDQWWQHTFLLRRRAFSNFLERESHPRLPNVSQRNWYLGTWKVLLYRWPTFEKQLAYTSQLGGPGGLDSWPFQHRIESAFLVVPSLFKKGVS